MAHGPGALTAMPRACVGLIWRVGSCFLLSLGVLVVKRGNWCVIRNGGRVTAVLWGTCRWNCVWLWHQQLDASTGTGSWSKQSMS